MRLDVKQLRETITSFVTTRKRKSAATKKNAFPRGGDDRRKDRRRALQYHRLAVRGVNTERRKAIRRDDDLNRCKYDPWYTFHEFNPQLVSGTQGSGKRP